MKLLFTVTLLAAAALHVRGEADRFHPEEPVGRVVAVKNLLETNPQYWRNQAQAALKRRAQHAAPAPGAGGGGGGGGRARNVVMFMGDGMSVPTLAAARILLGQRRDNTGEETELFFESFPTLGMAKTYCVNSQVPDSACTATAYLCGVKTNRGLLGVSAAVARHDCVGGRNEANYVESIAEWALADGRDAGFVTTTRVTHASPGGTYAKTANRNWEIDADIVSAGFNPVSCPDITHQLVHLHPGNKFKVILGGGRRTFLPTTVTDEEGTAGRRTDGRNLIEEWQQDKIKRNVTYNYIWNREQLRSLNSNLPEYLLGLFENNHMQYHSESNIVTEPTLAELTETAIRMLSRNEKGFFLFVEGGRIDHAHHDNRMRRALDETLELDKAVAVAAELLSEEDSLIVVTADHAHVMAFSGYSPRGQDILGPSSDRDLDRVPYMTLSYVNGPGFRAHVGGSRPDVTRESNYERVNWRAHVDVPLEEETHGGDDVVVYARGPHHHLFTGLYEQSHIPHRMAYAACLGPGLHACSAEPALPEMPALPELPELPVGAVRDAAHMAQLPTAFALLAAFFAVLFYR